MTLRDPDLVIRDLDLSCFRAKNESHSGGYRLLLDFLQQFRDGGSRRVVSYQCYTELIVVQCAQIQWDIVSENSVSVSKLPESALLIAMSLRALNYTYAYCKFVDSIRWQMRKIAFRVPEISYKCPFSFEISRQNPGPQTLSDPSSKSRDHFSSMIQDIVRIFQQTLLRRRPTEWPSLLCVLALLNMIRENLGISTESIRPFIETVDALSEVCLVLGQLYHMCTKGKHPLAKNCKWEDYASLIGYDQLAVAHFRSLNEIWVEYRSENTLSCVAEIFEILIDEFKI